MMKAEIAIDRHGQSTTTTKPSKLFQEIDYSIATAATDDCSSVVSEDTEWTFHEEHLEERPRRVRFATTLDGKVLCQVKGVERLRCPELWWQAKEDEAIRVECGRVVDALQAKFSEMGQVTDNFLVKGWKIDPQTTRKEILQQMRALPEGRGLERHVAGTEPTDQSRIHPHDSKRS